MPQVLNYTISLYHFKLRKNDVRLLALSQEQSCGREVVGLIGESPNGKPRLVWQNNEHVAPLEVCEENRIF